MSVHTLARLDDCRQHRARHLGKDAHDWEPAATGSHVGPGTSCCRVTRHRQRAANKLQRFLIEHGAATARFADVEMVQARHYAELTETRIYNT